MSRVKKLGVSVHTNSSPTLLGYACWCGSVDDVTNYPQYCDSQCNSPCMSNLTELCRFHYLFMAYNFTTP